ncbi:MAG: hypothetical protein RLZZ126_1676, partial [Pseudomonadota bacterium]
MSQPAHRKFTPLSKLPNFDPQKVPVAAVDSHLPPVGSERLQAPALRQRFALPPAWDVELRQEPPTGNRSPMPAAVLVPIVLRAEPTLLLTQ